jgi:hypothetical protein
MLALFLLALTSADPAAQAAGAGEEKPVCREVLRRTELTFFRYRKEKLCMTEAAWRAADARQAHSNDLNAARQHRSN